ncbi:alanyl-tRNA editing protein [Glycomyces halotolerans]
MTQPESQIAAFTALSRTEKLYHHEPRATECEATVVRRRGNLVALDRTLFYAESGGQVADHGRIDDYRVVDVKKVGGRPFQLPNGEIVNVDTVFVHTLDHPEDEIALEEGRQVTCHLDWDRRFRNMQMHTLAHLLFTAVGEVLAQRGAERHTLGCFIEGERARFDFYNEITPEDVPVVLEWINDRLAKGGTATVTPIEGADDALLWQLEDISIPCGGTHVNDLTEITGRVDVKRRTKGRGKIRMTVTLDRDAPPSP